MASVMPCTAEASGGIARPGWTRLDQVSPSSPPSITTVATSMIACPPAGLRPVVSVSTATSRWPLRSPRGPPCRGSGRPGGVGPLALHELLERHARLQVPFVHVAEQEQEAIGLDVAGDAHRMIAGRTQEDRRRVAGDAQARGERAGVEPAPLERGGAGPLGVEL